jgi:hypothetical protein
VGLTPRGKWTGGRKGWIQTKLVDLLWWRRLSCSLGRKTQKKNNNNKKIIKKEREKR